MKRIFYLIACVAVLCTTWSCYDDSELRKDIDELKAKVSKLEGDVNGNVSAIEALAQAMNGSVTITSVVTVEDGYKITFSDGTEVKLTNGADGADGKDGANGNDGTNGKDGVNGNDGKDAPVLGIMKEGDILYWTLGGEPLLYEGEKIPVSGADGKDGKTPQFKIEDGIWLISFDGSEWSEIPVTGAVEVETLTMTETDTEYVFSFGATEMRIPKEGVFAIKVSGDELELKAGMSLTFTYEIVGADETTHVVIETENITAELDETEQTVKVIAPDVIENAYVLVKAVRNSDAKYSAQYICIKKMSSYGTFGGYIVSHENEYLNW